MAGNMTAAGIQVIIPADPAKATGPRIIGFLFHWGLFGALCVQVYLYHLAFPKDPRRNKILVYSVFALEFAQTMMITKSAFTVFGGGYGQLERFNKVSGPSWIEVPIITGVVAFIAEAFYAYRISVLAQSYWVASVILFLATVQLGGAFAAGILLKNAVLFSNLLGRSYSIAAGIWNGGSAACDIIIAVCMTYYLSRAHSGMKETNVLLKRIITLVIETGTITAAVALLDLVFVILPSKPSYYLTPSETLAKFYSNSMMVVLNSRMRIGIDNDADGSFSGRTRIRTGNNAVSQTRIDTNAYELGEGVVVTREQVVFPGGDEVPTQAAGKAYLV